MKTDNRFEIMQKTYQSTLEVVTKPRDIFGDAQNLIKKGQYDKALDLIGDDNSLEALILKGDIYVKTDDFENAVKSFDEALAIEDDENLRIKKADALYRMAKLAYFPEANFDRAMALINRAFQAAPEGEHTLEYWFLKGEIYQSQELHIDARRCFLKAEERFEELEILERELAMFEKHKGDILINVTGVNFYRGIEVFHAGDELKLVKDYDNEHDSDAVACYLNDEMVGYVANSDYTLINNVKSASDIQGVIGEDSTAVVLFIFQNEFVIAKVNV